jgi:hypothetical protein
MRKIIILGLGIIVTTLMTSCFKSSTCKCSVLDKTTGLTSTSNDAVTSFSGGKKQRETLCKAREQDDSYSTTTCAIVK